MTNALRRSRVCALTLAMLQVGALFIAPLAACCTQTTSASHEQAAASSHKCCAMGSHTPGPCPMHGAGKPTCRMACTSHDRQALPVAHAAIVPDPIAIDSTLPVEVCAATARTSVPASDIVPDSPPPRA